MLAGPGQALLDPLSRRRLTRAALPYGDTPDRADVRAVPFGVRRQPRRHIALRAAPGREPAHDRFPDGGVLDRAAHARGMGRTLRGPRGAAPSDADRRRRRDDRAALAAARARYSHAVRVRADPRLD